ncbi:hypothetical protein M0804_005933 [Polistes exclamans]|nr:hypothetical protein M0804_005933 [Polistes exclamans]
MFPIPLLPPPLWSLYNTSHLVPVKDGPRDTTTITTITTVTTTTTNPGSKVLLETTTQREMLRDTELQDFLVTPVTNVLL